jgi:hypothetical protein
MEDFILHFQEKANDKCLEWFRRISQSSMLFEIGKMIVYLTKNLPETEEILELILNEKISLSQFPTKLTQWKNVDVDKIKFLLDKKEITVIINKITPEMSDKFLSLFSSNKVRKQYYDHLIYSCLLNKTLDKLRFFLKYKPSTKTVASLSEICEGELAEYDPNMIYNILLQHKCNVSKFHCVMT